MFYYEAKYICKQAENRRTIPVDLCMHRHYNGDHLDIDGHSSHPEIDILFRCFISFLSCISYSIIM